MMDYNFVLVILLVVILLLTIIYFIGVKKILFPPSDATFIVKLLPVIYMLSILIGLLINGILIFKVLIILTLLTGLITMLKYVVDNIRT